MFCPPRLLSSSFARAIPCGGRIPHIHRTHALLSGKTAQHAAALETETMSATHAGHPRIALDFVHVPEIINKRW